MQPRTAHPGAAAESAAAEFAAAESAAAEFGAASFGAAESGAAEFGAAEFGAAESGAAESGAAEFGAASFGAAESSAAESAAAEFGAAQSGAGLSGAAESGAASFGAAESGTADRPAASRAAADRAAVVIVSDRSARGERPDAVGPVIVERLRAGGYQTDDPRVVPDGADEVEVALRAEVDGGARLILTSGGTGIGPRDRTPEGTRPVLARELPGIAEALRRDGSAHMPTAVLSRGLAGIADQTGTGGALIVNLPGSPGGARDGVELVLGIAAHAIAQLDGGDHVHGDRAHGDDTHGGDRAPGDHAHGGHTHGGDHDARGGSAVAE